MSGGPGRSAREASACLGFSGSKARPGAKPLAALAWRLTFTTIAAFSSVIRLMNALTTIDAARALEPTPGSSANTALPSTCAGVSDCRLLASRASILKTRSAATIENAEGVASSLDPCRRGSMDHRRSSLRK